MSNFSFNEAYGRLQQILDKLGAQNVSLEESIKLFEEADKLISEAMKKLLEAEQKIEILVKNRAGEMKTEPFSI